MSERSGMRAGFLARMAATTGAALTLAVLTRADGDVRVHVDRGGNLIVEGDGASNEIQISPTDIGVGTVRGLGSTRVNGGESAPFRGVDGDFRIELGGGDDHAAIVDGDGNHVPDDLDIDMGTGDDFVEIRGFFVEDDLRIRTGSGRDLVTLSDTVFVSGRTHIDTGSGDDEILFEPADVQDLLLVFDGRFVIDTRSGRDFVDIVGVLFRDEVDVDLGRGDDLGELGGARGGLSVCGSRFESPDVLADVLFSGGDGQDGAVLEGVCGLAPPGLVQDFLRRFESFPDDGSFLGGSACSRGCN